MAFQFLMCFVFLVLRTTAATPNITAVFAFGDSGNNNHLFTIMRSDNAPYGVSFPGRIPSGRFSDGKLSTDFVVSELGIKPLLPPYLDPTLTVEDLVTGVSFASAGTGLDDLTVREANVLSMDAQLRYFGEALGRIRSSVGPVEAGRIVENALFVVAVGTNDMLYNYYGLPLRTMYSVSQYHDLLLRNLETFITRLESMGARKVAVIGLPPIGCLPVQVTLHGLGFRHACVDHENADSQAYNAKLRVLLSRPSLAKFAYVDVYGLMMNMITSPVSFGLVTTLEGCCGIGALEMGPLCNAATHTCSDPSKYLFWDAAHPTQAAYNILATSFLRDVVPTLVN